MKQEIVILKNVLGWNALADAEILTYLSKKGLVSPQTKAEIEAVKKAEETKVEFAKLAGALWGKWHFPQNFSESVALGFKGDIKAPHRIIDFFVGLNGKPFAGSSRLCIPLMKYAKRFGSLPLGNGSTAEMLSKDESFIAMVRQFCFETNSNDYFVSKSGRPLNGISTIQRQLGLAKDLLFCIGIIDKTGALTNSGACRAIARAFNV